MLKEVPSSGTGVEELRREEAIWTFEVRNEMDCRQNHDREFSRQNCSEATADLASLIILSGMVHTGVEVCRNGLGDEQTCETTLASAYVLRRLSVAWSQLQMKEGKSEWE